MYRTYGLKPNERIKGSVEIISIKKYYFMKFWKWLVKSSANADKWSLTAKATLTGLIPSILYFSGLMNVQLDNELLTQFVNKISEVIVYLGGAVTAIAWIVGFCRKIITSIFGTNDVINNM